MAILVANLVQMDDGNGYSRYRYDTTDSLATVEAAGYFNNSDDNLNLALGDKIDVVVWTTAVRTGTIALEASLIVSAISSGSVTTSSGSTEIVTAANVLTAAESGKTFILNSATAFATTLPLVAAGLHFTFYAGATQVTGGNHTIVPNAANDNTIYGDYNVAGATVPASAEGSINFIADTMLPGDKVEVFCDGTNWYVSGGAAATGGVTFTT